MLILTRLPGQKIRIGESVYVTVSQVKGQQVRIGIEAPIGIPILRTELEGKPIAPGSRGDPRRGS